MRSAAQSSTCHWPRMVLLGPYLAVRCRSPQPAHCAPCTSPNCAVQRVLDAASLASKTCSVRVRRAAGGGLRGKGSSGVDHSRNSKCVLSHPGAPVACRESWLIHVSSSCQLCLVTCCAFAPLHHYWAPAGPIHANAPVLPHTRWSHLTASPIPLLPSCASHPLRAHPHYGLMPYTVLYIPFGGWPFEGLLSLIQSLGCHSAR